MGFKLAKTERNKAQKLIKQQILANFTFKLIIIRALSSGVGPSEAAKFAQSRSSRRNSCCQSKCF